MEKRYKDILRPLVAELRRTLAGTADGSTRGDLDRELERLGLAPDGTVAQADVVANPTAAERRARAVAAGELGAIADLKERIAARAAFVERAAYGWINRLLALRVLEARGLIDETLRANPDYDGLSEALYVLRQSDPQRASGPDGGWWAVIEDACAAQAAALPGLFATEPAPATGPATAAPEPGEALFDLSIALRPSTTALLRCIELLGGAPPTAGPAGLDAACADPDAIGWAYQFYQEEAKAQVYARLKGGKKVGTRDEIAAATQLFTEPYMVKWLLQNSLGRSYHEAYPQSVLPDAWEYYIRPQQLDAPAFTALESLTVLDPCMGSGHFLREAFDLLVTMYREQQPELDATAMADRILARHLHGIDIDPRAAQLAAFTLYARAWELLRDERRARRQAGSGRYAPAALNLATTPGSIPAGALARHLQRHPGDRPLQPLLEGVFTALENADILGSLLRPREHLAAAIAELRKPRQLPMQADPELQAVQDVIENILHTDPSRLEEMLLERVATSFAAEARGMDDVAAALFGRAAERGVRLLQLLDRQYAVVVTNPPYMGSKNMDTPLRQYVERHYPSGKRDLYAAFILRCLEATRPGGRVAMVPPQSWMFLGSFADLRAAPEERLPKVLAKGGFTGLLREASLEAIVQLGRHAFAEADPPANPLLLVVRSVLPSKDHSMWGCRLSASQPSDEQAALLRRSIAQSNGYATGDNGRCTYTRQNDLLDVPDSAIVYFLGRDMLSLLGSSQRLEAVAQVRQGLATADDNRFIRFTWEVSDGVHRWLTLAKGGGYCRWFGQNWYHTDWEYEGARQKGFGKGRYQGVELYKVSGWSYSLLCRGNLSWRRLDSPGCFGHKGPGVYANVAALPTLAHSRVASYLLRAVSPQLAFEVQTVAQVPLPPTIPPILDVLAYSCERLKAEMVSSNPIERNFVGIQDPIRAERTAVWLHAIEGVSDFTVSTAYCLTADSRAQVYQDAGTPAGLFPLLVGAENPPQSDVLPLETVDAIIDLTERLPRLPADTDCRAALKAKLRGLYAGGQAEASDETENVDDEEEREAAAAMPLPTETFLEELSQKLQIHPISVYWLLQEIRAEGARCKPEEQRLLEDRLSVIVLRLLGHRWPKQLEAGEPVPAWADSDGIIPLLAGSGEAPLAERVRERLRAEDGALGAQQAEALLAELTGRSLEEWLRRDFFPRHVRQFKYRPIAWRLASTPQVAGASGPRARGKGGARSSNPAFECLVYYHAAGVGLLARIRTQYVEPLLHAERGRASAARQTGDDTTAAQAHTRVRELETFTERLRGVEEQGFACAELETIIDQEPLDRWSGDGVLAPSSHEALLAQEQAWMVDINDGVRVNIAPMQLAGVLAADVLKEADARKASADRARWRADERRWVREGVLPRCGWMAEDIPEAPRWTERAPEREAERAKLEAKRAEALRKLEGATG